MSFLKTAVAPVKSVLREVSPLEEVEEHILHTGESIKGATESIEGHVKVLEDLTLSLNNALPALTATLSTTLPELVQAVQDLGSKLEVVSEALAPVVEAEQEIGKIGHVFGHHHKDDHKS
ncbi:MAG: hypothetical protein J2O48_08010 [Solirubrobacterales bacterium]|nr:hypothetical protein [Solirubrobacterales bacterium]